MKRQYIPIFVLLLLLTQLGSLGHDYHIHDSAETCDYCLSAQALDHSVTPELQGFLEHSIYLILTEKVLQKVTTGGFYNYTARAPPHFI